MNKDGRPDKPMMRLLMWLSVSTLGTVVGFAGALPAAATVMERQGLSASVIGVITGLVYAGVLCMVPFQPRLARRCNAVQVYQMGKLLTASGYIGLTMADSAWTWALATSLIGLGAGLTWPVTDCLVASLAPEDKKGAWMGLFQTGVGGAFALGPFIASGLSPHAMFVTAAAVGMLTSLPLIGRRAPVASDASTSDASMWKVVCLAPELPLLGFIGGFFENGTHTAITLTALALDWKEGAAIALAGVIGAGAFVVQYPIGKLADVRGSHRILVITLLIMIASCLPLPLGGAMPSILWITAFIWGAAGGCIYTLSMTGMAQRFSGANLLTATTIMVMAYTVGGIIGPAVAGYAVEWSPLLGPMALFVLASLIGLLRRGAAFTPAQQRIIATDLQTVSRPSHGHSGPGTAPLRRLC